MQKITCEVCGGNELVKQNGLYVCQHCGTKYTLEKARQLFKGGTVTIDNSQKIDNLYQLARRAVEEEDFKEAQKYYDRIILEYPDNWEPVFYTAYCKAYNSRVKEITENVQLLKNRLPISFTLLREEYAEKKSDDKKKIESIAHISADIGNLVNELESRLLDENNTETYGSVEYYKQERLETERYLSLLGLTDALAAELETCPENDVIDLRKHLNKIQTVGIMLLIYDDLSGSTKKEIRKRLAKAKVEMASQNPDDRMVKRIERVLEKEKTVKLPEKINLKGCDITLNAEENIYIVKTVNPSGTYEVDAAQLTEWKRRYEQGQKSSGVMRVLWLFLGIFGVHRFYVGDTKIGILLFITFGGCILGWLLDGIFVGSRIEEYNDELMYSLLEQAIRKTQSEREKKAKMDEDE